uniref:VWFA domain-containing protein n=1 Tax=Sparus aurata TaxID=8175 RepID=A0A671U572_SPAAU
MSGHKTYDLLIFTNPDDDSQSVSSFIISDVFLFFFCFEVVQPFQYLFSLLFLVCFLSALEEKFADIVFLVDSAVSVQEFQQIRTLLTRLVNQMNFGASAYRLGLAQYARDVRVEFLLKAHQTKEVYLSAIRLFRQRGTNTGAALNYARDNVFIKARGSRKEQGVQQVAVVITDGKSQDDVSTAAADLRRAGVTIYAIGVKEANKALLDQMASYPHNKHVFNVDNFEKLKGLELSLQKSLCHNIIQQAISGGKQEHFAFPFSGCVKTEEADIFFLIDNSGSIFPTDFQDMKNFITEFIHTFRISPEHVRIGVVKYADSPQLEFDLARYSDTKSLEKAIEGIKQIGGGTKTGRALEYMGPLFDRTVVTPDHKVPEYLVVITDGKSSDQVKVPAEKLRAQGIIVYAIGVKSADPDELEKISGNPKRTFFVNNFDALSQGQHTPSCKAITISTTLLLSQDQHHKPSWC